MAFTNFYLDAGGNDMNAGSVQNHAAAAGPSTNGDWGNAAANRFTAASGTPFSAVNVNDWASVYVDGTTSGAVYVAQVTAVNAGGASIDLSTTAKYGTAPSNSATGRSCRVGGSWLSEFPLTTLTGTVPASTKINFNNNLTITASRTIALAGLTTAPLWFSGYNTNPGDLDNDTTNSLAKPIWTFNANFGLVTSGAHQIWSGLSVKGNASGVVWQSSSQSLMMSRCRVENTSSNAAAYAFQPTFTNTIAYSYFKAPSTGTTNGVVVANGTGSTYLGCVFDGGGLAGLNLANNQNLVVRCVFLTNTGAGILCNSAQARIMGCTFYGATVDGVKWTGAPAAGASVVGCLFSGVNGGAATTNGINNASGTNTNLVFRACNDYYNVTNREVGFGDSPEFFPQTDSSPVATSATNLTPVATANARARGFPGLFENALFSGYSDIGAVQSHPPPFGHPGLG
jgi:hypothetical protein